MSKKSEYDVGWYIYDRGQNKKSRTIYIHKPFATKEAAEYAREDLLQPYSSRSYWRQRLFVDKKD